VHVWVSQQWGLSCRFRSFINDHTDLVLTVGLRLYHKELERRLGSVIIQAFDDCVTVGTAFKLLDSFEAGAYTRPLFSSTSAVSDTKHILNSP